MLPLSLSLSFGEIFEGQNVSVVLHDGITMFVGPNGSGKSQVMRKMKSALQREVGNTLLLPSGRLQPFETGRLVTDPRFEDPTRGNTNVTLKDTYREQWYRVETAQGVLDRLSERKDLEIKVAERLRSLFKRELKLVWNRGSLSVRFSRRGDEYSSSREASGLLHLVVLLAALYDDELDAVLIDEPEISLHPQLQSFLLREIERVAGDPDDGKKIVALATHSAAMVRLQKLQDLPRFLFFSDASSPPVQVDASDGVLENQKLSTFVRNLGASHREALFAKRPLLVEGVSDEVVVDALDAMLDTHLHAAGSHILPVTGAGKMAPAVKLLRLIGKEPVVLADLDAFTDGLELVNALNSLGQGQTAANEMGHDSLHDAASDVHSALSAAVQDHWQSIQAYAEGHPYWTASSSSGISDAERKRRAAAATLLCCEESEIETDWSESDPWLSLRTRLEAVLSLLEKAGCFMLRAGAMEDTYADSGGRSDKIEAAYAEAEQIESSSGGRAGERHSVAIRALRKVAQVAEIDESAAVAKAFVAAVGPALAELREDGQAQTADLQAAASQNARESANLFEIERVDEAGDPAIQISLRASVLDVSGFPITLRQEENINAVAQRNIG